MPNLDNSSSKRFFVTGIGTDVGKTVVSAILTKALNAYYWKPLQSGTIEGYDSKTIESLVEDVRILPEFYTLKEPLSPHAAAEMESVTISSEKLTIPKVEGNLVIEGAGGLMVPIDNEGTSYLELAKSWELPVIVVSRHYLGSINHTLLTLEVLQQNSLNIAGVVFVGPENNSTESVIMKRTGVHVIGRIPIVDKIDQAFINEQAKQLLHKL